MEGPLFDAYNRVTSLALILTRRLSLLGGEVASKKSMEAETWQWTPVTMLGAIGVLAGAAALYLRIVKDDVIRPPPIADARVIIKGIKIPSSRVIIAP